MSQRFLTYQGSDVAPIARTAEGRAVVVYLERGHPTTHTAEAWPHQLRGLGWHLAAIKQLLARLPEFPSRPQPGCVSPGAAGGAPSPTPNGHAGGFLHAHHSLPRED
jgi:hypothetical protein